MYMYTKLTLPFRTYKNNIDKHAYIHIHTYTYIQHKYIMWYRQAWLVLLHFNKVRHPRWHECDIYSVSTYLLFWRFLFLCFQPPYNIHLEPMYVWYAHGAYVCMICKLGICMYDTHIRPMHVLYTHRAYIHVGHMYVWYTHWAYVCVIQTSGLCMYVIHIGHMYVWYTHWAYVCAWVFLTCYTRANRIHVNGENLCSRFEMPLSRLVLVIWKVAHKTRGLGVYSRRACM
jgi:hypothetical protein